MTECQKKNYLQLTNVWKTCNKIKEALFKSKINLAEIFSSLDKGNTCYLPAATFLSVFSGPLKYDMELSDQEIIELAEYFKIKDGRVYYTQLVDVLSDQLTTDISKTKQYESGLEWDDPMKVNYLSETEERQLNVLLFKIASTVNSRRLVLQPYFQDYELVTKNTGAMSLAHFARILNFLKIYLNKEDFHLLARKFQLHGYLFNYVAFLETIDLIKQELVTKNILDVGGDLLSQFPGRILTSELPKLPRPEIGNVSIDKILKSQVTFHPVLNERPKEKVLYEVIQRIQKYVLGNRVRIVDVFKDFDRLNSGKVSESVFKRCLSTLGIGVSGPQRFLLTSDEINSVTNFYRDPNDPILITWKIFQTDVDSVFLENALEKRPETVVERPLQDVVNLSNPGNRWEQISGDLRDSSEEVIAYIKRKVDGRRMELRPPFNDLDKHKLGHVSRSQFRTILQSNGFHLTDQQLYLLEQRYLDDLGINYFLFFHDLEETVEDGNLYEKYQTTKAKVNSKVFRPEVTSSETNIVEILAKIKRTVTCYRIELLQFLSQFDLQNQLAISEENFTRGLDQKLELTPTEVKTIIEIFRSPARPGCVDYRRFCNVIGEVFTQQELHRAPLLEPIQHLAINEDEWNFLNFEDRRLVSYALHKIANRKNESLVDCFSTFDPQKNGLVQLIDVTRAFSMLNLHTVLSGKEIQAITKCFTRKRGHLKAFYYPSFCQAVDIVNENVRSMAC